MNKNSKKIIIAGIVGIIGIVIIIAFFELFIGRFLSSNIRFQELSHYENRADLLSFTSICVTTVLSYAVYYLSKTVDKKEQLERDRKRYESICMVYDYLNEIILYIKKIVFNDKEDYTVLMTNGDFIKAAYNLTDDVFDKQDIELIRNINKSVNDYLNRNNKEKPNSDLSIKWIYKNVFDLNMKITDIEELNNLVDVDMLLNTQLVSILIKLRRELGYEWLKNIEYDNIKLIIENHKNSVIVEKKYEEGYYIRNGNGRLKIYEPLFYMGDPLYRNGALIYEGNVNKNKKNGNGKYYYRVSNGIDVFLNSFDLIDRNATRIKKILEKNNIETNQNVVFIGKFKDNVFSLGEIQSLEGRFESITIK